jgi:ketosteroid isomerase-like protein
MMLLSAGALLAVAGAADTPRAAFERYIHSVVNRDYAQFVRSVTTNERFHFINSKGERLDSRREYLDWHRRWFGETNWEISYEPPLIAQEGNAAYAMAVFHYRERGAVGTCRRLDAYFTLVMVKENDEWRAVADIVTPISSK